MPGEQTQTFDSAGVALREMALRRAELEDRTGAKASFGWYVRMDRHIAGVYGDAFAIAKRYQAELEARRREGDEIGLHIHSIEKTDRGWRANYADAALINETIEEAVANFSENFGFRCQAARMGDMWSAAYCMEKFASLGVRYDLTLESGLRPRRISALYPGTKSLGVRPSMVSVPLTPFQPELAGSAVAEDFWAIPLTSYRRRDFAHPGMWIVSVYSAVSTGFKRGHARDVFRPQAFYAPGMLRRAVETYIEECETPCICVAIRNFGVPNRIHHFLDVLCEVAKDRPIRFVGPEGYVCMAAEKETGLEQATRSATVR
mgnify:CR=1 FL=1